MVKVDKLLCTGQCGKERKSDDFYVSHSPIHKHTGKLSICKDCLVDLASKYKDGNDYDLKQVQDTLRRIDRPFLDFLWDSTIDEANNNGKDAFKIYMKNLGMKQYRELTWDDSNHNVSESFIHTNEENDYKPDKDTIQYWGRGYDDWEYSFLEEEKYKLMSSFECPDYGMEMIMKDICIINLDIEKLRQERKDNSGKAITNLIKTRSDLMNDANMKPIQSTGAEGNDQITFGTLIKKWENEKPIPKPLDDEMKEYIDTFMVGHLAKMEGLTNELTEKYDEALSKYTIDFEELNKDDDEVDD